MKFSPCIELFFTDLDLDGRLERVAALGYEAFEFWTWWDKDVDLLAESAERHELTISGCCTDFVPLTDPNKRRQYLDRLEDTLKVADRLGISTIISQVGQDQSNVSRGEQRESIITGLREAARILAGSGKRLVIEPLNTKYDHPGYFLSSSAEARQILEAVGSTEVGLLFDIYHQQVTEGDVTNNLRASLEWAWHVHIADSPGRHEIGTGELNYQNILANLEKWGYSGYVGIELFPISSDHSEALTGSVFDAPRS